MILIIMLVPIMFLGAIALGNLIGFLASGCK